MEYKNQSELNLWIKKYINDKITFDKKINFIISINLENINDEIIIYLGVNLHLLTHFYTKQLTNQDEDHYILLWE